MQYHVPVRSTSAKVRGAKVEAQQNQATKKQEALPMATAAPQLWQVAAQNILQGMLASFMQQSKDVLNGGTCNLQFLTKSTGSLPLVPSRRSVLDDQEMPAKQEHAPAVPEDKQPGASAEPEDKAEEAPKEEKSLEDWEMTAFQSIQAKKQRKKGEPPSSQNKKVGKNKSLMKRPAAVMKRPAARVPTAGSSAAGPPSASGSWGAGETSTDAKHAGSQAFLAESSTAEVSGRNGPQPMAKSELHACSCTKLLRVPCLQSIALPCPGSIYLRQNKMARRMSASLERAS